MRAEFVEWTEQSRFADGPADAEFFVKIADLALQMIGEERPAFVPTAWTPDDVHLLWAIMEDIEADTKMGAEVPGDVAADGLANAAFALLLFLGDSGYWTGTDADLDHCLDDLDPEGPVDGPAPEQLSAATVSPEIVEPDVERAALMELPVMERLSKFVEWLGDGKAVTGTRVLKPADASELAGLLEIETPPSKLRTMLDVAELRRLWVVAQGVGLVDVRSTKAYPGANVSKWGSRDLDLMRVAAAESVKVLFADHDPNVPAFQQAELLAVQFLLAGLTDKPLAFPLDLPADAPVEVVVIGFLLEQLLEELADEDLVTIDESVVVPKPLAHVVHSGVLSVENLFDELFASRADLE